jgi:hypothetical protein
MGRDLTAEDTGTSYSSSDSAVLGVHPNGLIQARRTGRAILSVTNSGNTSTVDIDVTIPAGSTNNIPVVAAPPEQTVTGETLVTLSVNASDPDGDPLTYVWEQFEGRAVYLRTPQSQQPVFVSPDVRTEQVLEFAAVVTDSNRATSFPVVVRVRVQPKAP